MAARPEAAYAPTKKVLKEAYWDNVEVDRTGSGTFKKLHYTSSGSSPAEPDPLGEWFPYDDQLNDLYAANPDGDQLVLDCFSELLCCGEVIGPERSCREYRHLLAFHLGRGADDGCFIRMRERSRDRRDA